MEQDLNNKTKEELVVLMSSYYASMQSLSKLYLKSKTENNYLKRKTKIAEDRVSYMKDIWEKRNRCLLTFEKIDADIRRKKYSKNIIKFEGVER